MFLNGNFLNSRLFHQAAMTRYRVCIPKSFHARKCNQRTPIFAPRYWNRLNCRKIMQKITKPDSWSPNLAANPLNVNCFTFCAYSRKARRDNHRYMQNVLQAKVAGFLSRRTICYFRIIRKIIPKNDHNHAKKHHLFQICGIVTCRSRMSVSVFLRTYFQGVRRQQSKIDEGDITDVTKREDRKWSREGIA